MKFTISRTSDYINETQPCDGAIIMMVAKYDYRISNTFEEFDHLMMSRHIRMKPFLNHGTEHEEIEGGGIVRRLDDERAWVLELDTIAELMNFMEKYGEIVMGPSDRERPPHIEIYDDYRE